MMKTQIKWNSYSSYI